MYKRAAEKLTQAAILNHVIDSDEKELYMYAYQAMFARLLGWGTLLLLGVVFQCIPGTLAFFIMFFPLRIYAGGYHARDYGRCYLASTLVFGILIIGSKIIAFYVNPLAILVSLMISLVMILMLAPLGDQNKPLSDSEQKKYGRIAKAIAVAEVIAVIAMMVMKIRQEIVLFSTFAIFLEALLLFFPRWKEIFHLTKNTSPPKSEPQI